MFGAGLQLGQGNMGDRSSDPRSSKVFSRAQRSRYSVNHNGGVTAAKVNNSVVENWEPENRTRSEEKCRSVTSSASFRRSNYGNLDRFLESATPTVPAQYLPKTCMKGLQNSEAEYYTLDDLWDSFKEPSAYGAGVPLVLNGSDSVVQYYVPFLSAIQLYAVSSRSTIGKRYCGAESEASDCEYFRDTSSETSSDSEAERGHKCSHQLFGFDRLTIGNQTKGCQECSFSDDSEGSNSPGYLVFEYFERASPFSREPLYDKVADLARNCPELKTLRSIDLLPASWMSVAWYPIYRIPTGPTLRDLDACFLTFHPLATCFKDSSNSQFAIQAQTRFGTVVRSSVMSPKISLPAFGLASYKFRGMTWTSNGSGERQQVHSLLQSADKWLRLLQVEHPDFKFFISRSASNRR